MNWAEVLWLGLCMGVVASTIFYAYRRGHSNGWVFGFSDGYHEAIEYRRHAEAHKSDFDPTGPLFQFEKVEKAKRRHNNPEVAE